jgi:hypothetical protein
VAARSEVSPQPAIAPARKQTRVRKTSICSPASCGPPAKRESRARFPEKIGARALAYRWPRCTVVHAIPFVRMVGMGRLLAGAGGATAGPASYRGSGELTRVDVVSPGPLRCPGGRREAAAIQRLEHSPVTPADHRGHLLRSARAGLSISLNGTNQRRARCSADCTAIRHANFTKDPGRH